MCFQGILTETWVWFMCFFVACPAPGGYQNKTGLVPFVFCVWYQEKLCYSMFTVKTRPSDGSLHWLDHWLFWSNQWREPLLGLVFTVNIQWPWFFWKKFKNASVPVPTLARLVLAVVKKISIFLVILTPNLFHLVQCEQNAAAVKIWSETGACLPA